MTILEEKMLHHVKDGLCPKVAPIKFPFGKKYLALKTLEGKTFGIYMIFHACFPNMAKLKANRFLNPKPPFFFMMHILSQANQLIPFTHLLHVPYQ